MTKREEAAQLYAELTEMAAGNATATAMLDDYNPDDGGGLPGTINKTWVDEFQMNTFITVLAYDKISGKEIYNKQSLELRNREEHLKIPANSNIKVYIWCKAKVIDKPAYLNFLGSNEEEIVTQRFELLLESDLQKKIVSHKLVKEYKEGYQEMFEKLNVNVSVSVSNNNISVYGSIIIPRSTISNTSSDGKWTFNVDGKLVKKDIAEVGAGVKYESGQNSKTITYNFAQAEITPAVSEIYIDLTEPVTKPNYGGNYEGAWFEFNKSNLTNEATRGIQNWWAQKKNEYDARAINQILINGNYSVIVTGFADPKGNDVYNSKLGTRRAEATIAFLKTVMAGGKGKFAAATAGESQAIGNNYAGDRRVKIEFMLD